MHADEFLQKVRQGQRDFRNISLRNANLVGEQLALLNLDGANLEGSNLSHVNLAGSSLAHAQLEWVILVGANLLSVQCFKANFKGADLSNALLSGAEFQGSNLKQANLSESSCVGIDLSGASLRFADLSNANLKSAKLKGTDLYGAEIQGLDLEGADLEDIIWPDGTEEITIDRAYDAYDKEEEPSFSPDPPSVSQPSGTIDSEKSSDQKSMLFGDFEMENSESLARWSSLLFPRASSQSVPKITSESPQQANLRIANQIASRLERQVQYSFKKYIKKVYGDRCACSNSSISVLLEAVVIFPEAETNQDHPSNGLLLRVDLARLFDLNLMTIDPENYQILIAPSLRQTEYSSFTGMKLRLPKEARYHPSPISLRWHFEQCEWIHNPNLGSSESVPILEMNSTDLISTSAPRSSRLFQASKSWIKRINQVLHAPIPLSIDPEKISKEHSVPEHNATIVSFAPVEMQSETLPEAVKTAETTSETSIEAIKTVETIVEEKNLTRDLTSGLISEQSLESSLSESSLSESPDLGSNVEIKELEVKELEIKESILPLPPPPPLYRVKTSVTQNLDRLQQSLDTIIQDLEPYLKIIDRPLENINEMIDSIEKELEESIKETNAKKNIDLTPPRKILDSERRELTSESATVVFEDLFDDTPLMATEIKTDSEDNYLLNDPVQAEPIPNVELPDLSLGSELGSELDSELDSELGSELGSELDSDLGSELDSELGSELDSELGSELDSELNLQIESTPEMESTPELELDLGLDLNLDAGLELNASLVADLEWLLSSDVDTSDVDQLETELNDNRSENDLFDRWQNDTVSNEIEKIELETTKSEDLEPSLDIAEVDSASIVPEVIEAIEFDSVETSPSNHVKAIDSEIAEAIALDFAEMSVSDVAEALAFDFAKPIAPDRSVSPSASPEMVEQAEEKITEEPIPPVRKGLAALLFRRFHR